MHSALKHLLQSCLPNPTAEWLRRERVIHRWRSRGCPLPPPKQFKQHVVKKFARRYKPEVFIETGTYLGDMVETVRNEFLKIFSIELDDRRFADAAARFKDFDRIVLRHGASEEELPKILSEIRSTCLFWLDAHYSGTGTAHSSTDTPILSELRTIFDHPIHDHVILIDDARCFVGKDDYPTIEELRRVVIEARPTCRFEVADDIIRITPAE